MSIDPRLHLLLNRWRQSQERGQPLSVEELCRDCPELRPELERRIAAGHTEDPFLSPTTIAPLAKDKDVGSSILPTIGNIPPPPSRVGLAGMPVVAGYDIEGELGRGGMGVVYKARQTDLNRVVALKMILSGRKAGAEERLRFFAEAKVLAAIEHPGIVKLHDYGTHEGSPYFALEYCAGGTLADRLDGTPLPAAQAALILEQIARAVQAAHEKGIIHRDLKPSNVLIDSLGQPRVTDFGLARRIEQNSGLTQTGAPMGTPSYMAPEQAQGKKDIGPAADVYSLGAILYECLTGRPPFKAASVMETLDQVVTQEPVTPRTLQPKVPRDLETICLKCLQKEPHNRYARAEELAEDLRRWQAREPILAQHIGPLGRLAKWVLRRPLLAGMATATVLALLGGTAVSTYFAVDAREQKKEAVKKEAEAREALAEVEENLALGLLRPLGHFRDEEKLNDFELDALEELASLPHKRDRVRLLFFEQALQNESRAGQLDRRLEECVIAAVALRRDLREKVLVLCRERLQDDSTPSAVRLVSARLAARLKPDEPRVIHLASGVLIEVLKHSDRGELLPGLARAVESISTRAGPAESAELGQKIIELTAGTTDLQILRILSRTLTALASRIAQQDAASLGKRIAELSNATTDSHALRALSEAAVALKNKLSGAERETLAAALDKPIFELAQKTDDPAVLRELAAAAAALSSRPAPPADQRIDAFGKRIVAVAVKTTNAGALNDLAAALASRSDGLEPRNASQLAAALANQIVALAGTATDDDVPLEVSSAESRLPLAAALAAVSNRLAPADAGKLALALGKQIADLPAGNAEVAVLRALSAMQASLSGKLSKEEAAKLSGALGKQIVARAAKTTDAGTLRELSEALAGLSGKAVSTDAVVLATQIAALVPTTRDADDLRALAQALASLASRLPADQLRGQAASLAGQVIDQSSKTSQARSMAALAEAFAATASSLPPSEASAQAASLRQQIDRIIGATTDADGLRSVAQAVVAVAPWLPREQASKAAAAIAAHLARTLHRQRGNRELPFIFEKLCGLLSPQQLVDLLEQPGCVEPGPTIIVRSLGRLYRHEFRDVWDLVPFVEQLSPPLDCSAPLDREKTTPRAALRTER